jgi:hypothetical protein
MRTGFGINRIFQVYCDDQVKARYILSTSLMEQIIEFSKKANKKIYISFAEGRIYIAIKHDEELFEPNLYRSLISFAPVREYFETIQLMLGIVEELNLNRNIWLKD